ncbi:MAG TPA: L-aspartate oxidase [Gammaproteobacteria bacterium]
MTTQSDNSILIVGGGIAGLSTALRLADAGHAVMVLSKTELANTASFQAQGGIAAVMDAADSLSSHHDDTLIAGAGLCHSDTVAQVVREGPDCIRWLEDHGVAFTREPDGVALHLTREGGHSRRRIVHADDATGAAVMSVLVEQVRRHPSIAILENRFVVNLVTTRELGLSGRNRCVGLRVLDNAAARVETLWANAVVLATGGASGIYQHATNASTGDGIAMAWRAGCSVANMEFVQFHPTCLYTRDSRSALISEAVRGEGGRLLRPDGTPFMARYDSRAELAPRDIVSRAIVSELAENNLEFVHLDISHEPAELIRERFPNILRLCAAHGIDMTREPIPVVPAAHYTCGGIVTDRHGETDIEQLYAVGECSFTGLHGANRLASNSLLEALAFAKTVSGRIAQQAAEAKPPLPRLLEDSSYGETRRRKSLERQANRLRRLMWENVGIVRSRESLETASSRIDDLKQKLDRDWSDGRLRADVLELRNLVTVAELITRSASQRQESRGLHFISDYPGTQSQPRDTALRPD